MSQKLIRHDIRLPQWADIRIKEMSEHSGIQEAILLRSMVIERLREMGAAPVKSLGMNSGGTLSQVKTVFGEGCRD